MGERTLLLGYNLGDEKTQIAVYDKKTREPVLIGRTEENPDAFIDTEIVMEGRKPLVGFVDKIRRGEEIVMDGRHSHPANVLAHFFRKTLSLTRQQYPGETIRQLVVTARDVTQEFAQIIYEALEKIGIGKERAFVAGYKQSFLYYVLYQKKDIWVHDVGLFDYYNRRLTYYQMHVDSTKKPKLVGVNEKDYSDAIEFSASGEEYQASVIENVIYGAVHKQLLSTMFMTGDGFEGSWADEVFRKLCIGRRLFKGQNLYVSGACFAAREIAETPRLESYLLLDDEMIKNYVWIEAYADAGEQEIVLAKAGTPWYLVDEEVDIIPDGDNEILLMVRNVFHQGEKQFLLDLEPVLTRVDRHCRIGMRVRFSSPDTCVVTLKDKGFGEFFPTSHRIWEKSFKLD